MARSDRKSGRTTTEKGQEERQLVVRYVCPRCEAINEVYREKPDARFNPSTHMVTCNDCVNAMRASPNEARGFRLKRLGGE